MEIQDPNNQTGPALTTTPETKKWYTQKGFIITFLVIIIGGVAVGVYLKLSKPKIVVKDANNQASQPATSTSTVQDDSNLQLPKLNIADSDNSFPDFLQMNNCTPANIDLCKSIITLPQGFNDLAYTNYLSPAKWDQSAVDGVLQENQQALTLFDQAANKKYFQIPDYEDPATVNAQTKTYPLNTWREVARLQAIKALSFSWQNKPDEALLEAVKLNKVGHAIINSYGNGAQPLVGVYLQELGAQTILQILSYGKPSAETLGEVIKELQDSNDNISGFKNRYKMQYVSTINTLNKFPNHPEQFFAAQFNQDQPDPDITEMLSQYPSAFDADQTKNLLQYLYSNEAQAIGQTCGVDAQDSVLVKTLSFDPGSDPKTTENWLGKNYVFKQLLADVVLNTPCQNELLNKVAEIEVALKNYKLDNTNLPSQLTGLVPHYLPEVPLDPYDHQPLRYDSTKMIIYSVGTNKKDLGGSQATPEDLNPLNWDNPTFKINF